MNMSQTPAVLPAPQGAADGRARARTVRRVLLATDLDAASSRANEQAITLAARDGAVLQILAVAKRHRDRERLERGLQVLLRRARASGVRATSFIWHGEPAEAILEAAWTERPDVIVVGARQHRYVARILGSVSTKVANESPCRVEVVPAG
jgi:nucleotide-binding universal stress UspA family protein